MSEKDFSVDLEKCLEVLHTGGIILYPTDTVWGLGCDATNASAVAKIFNLKKRAESKSMIVLIAEERNLIQYVASVDLAVFDYLDTVTKPTTVIYDGAIGLADNLVSADGSIGIRIVKEDFCRHLIKRFRKPIVSTSANIAGEPTAAFFDEVTTAIKDGVDYIVKYRQHDKTPAVPSSVVKWSSKGVKIIRP
ncbi:MAG: threonylcarbamoyl-AMP synthase [Proteobacteria bacterium]|nr:MAG: threonylcarbamoyl-AMP synthase [Pseudomonadota bacterium]